MHRQLSADELRERGYRVHVVHRNHAVTARLEMRAPRRRDPVVALCPSA